MFWVKTGRIIAFVEDYFTGNKVSTLYVGFYKAVDKPMFSFVLKFSVTMLVLFACVFPAFG